VDPSERGLPAFLDEVAANAWPALIVQHLDGWRLRATPGVRARRSSSVLPLDFGGALSLEERFALVDDFYRRWNEPVRYQISPAAQPSDLDERLADRGYEIEAPVDIQTAALPDVLARTEASEGTTSVRITDRVDEPWLATTVELFGRGDTATMRERILDRIASPAAYALLEIDGRPASLGMGVLERAWLGIFSMGTTQEFRRQGAATAVLNALARWASQHGGEHAYLQVESDNQVAHRLYEGAGFTTTYGYHYRTALST